MSTVRKVRTAIVGCGMISNIYIHNLKNLFYITDLVALCDHKQETAAQKAREYGIEKVMTLEEIAASKDIELVVNLTGPAAHYDVIRMMLDSGKHVYTEKMMAVTLEQGQELVALAKEKHLYLGVAPDTILGAGIQTARKIMDAGLIGNVTSCYASINRNQSLNSEKFRFLRNNGGALPYDVGIYYIAALLCLLGPVRSVRGFGAPAPLYTPQLLYELPEIPVTPWQIPGNNLMIGALEFESGVLGGLHFDGNTIGESQHALKIFGTEGILELGDPNTFNGYVKLIRPEAEPCLLPLTHGYNGDPVLSNPTSWEYAYGHRGIGVAEMAWAIRQNRPCRCSKEYGLHAMEVLCGLDEAAANGNSFYPKSRFTINPLPSGYFSSLGHGQLRGDAEISLMN